MAGININNTYLIVKWDDKDSSVKKKQDERPYQAEYIDKF